MQLRVSIAREIASWLRQPSAQKVLTASSAYICPKDSASNAGSRDLFHTRSVTGSTVSSTAGTKVRSTAKKAALEAKLATLQKLYDLQIKRVKNSTKKSGTPAASRNRRGRGWKTSDWSSRGQGKPWPFPTLRWTHTKQMTIRISQVLLYITRKKFSPSSELRTSST